MDAFANPLDYTANAVNEYTQTDAPETFTHDDDGNLMYEFEYDYMGRHLSLLRRMAENSTKCLVL